jgi:hypothetical protein
MVLIEGALRGEGKKDICPGWKFRGNGKFLEKMYMNEYFYKSICSKII